MSKPSVFVGISMSDAFKMGVVSPATGRPRKDCQCSECRLPEKLKIMTKADVKVPVRARYR